MNAKTLFEELGYMQNIDGEVIQYKRRVTTYDATEYIEFYNDIQEVQTLLVYDSDTIEPKYLCLEEISAIALQYSELNWK